MNSTIFVQQNIGIPAGPLTQADDSPADQQEVSKSPKKAVGAIIRPMPRVTGKEGTVRLDQAQAAPPKVHVRNFDLDGYVNWLKAKIEKDKLDVRNVSEQPANEAAEALDRAISIPQVEKQTSEPAITKLVRSTAPPKVQPSSAVPGARMGQVSIEQIKATLEGPSKPKPKAMARPKVKPKTQPRGFSTAKMTRVDQPHDGIAEAYLKFDELRAKQTVVNAPLKTSNPLTNEDTEALVSRISKAIASVLTDTSEAEFEQKIQSQVKSEMQALATGVTDTVEVVDGVEVDKLDRATLAELAESGGNSIDQVELEAEKVAEEIFSQPRQEVPTSVAAWDVQDFRWPVITNRMIVSGGDALNSLTESVFEQLSEEQNRLVVAGLGRNEGTTSIAISVARWAAASGRNVLLVDADLVTPNLTKQVGLAPNLSWINAVSQSQPAAEVIVRSQQSNLCIMPLAQMVSRVTWPRFIYDNLGEVIDQVSSHFDLVVLDVGPANQLLAELSRPSLLVDGTLLVHDGINSSEFQKTKNRLEVFGIDKLTVAQNRAQHRAANVA